MSQPVTSTSLVGALWQQTGQRGTQVALRHKVLGIWQETTWQQLADEVARLASALAGLGLAHGHTLLLLSQQRPQALLLSLAAQWLGAEAVPLDPQLPHASLALLLQNLSPAVVLAEGQAEVELILAVYPAGVPVIHVDARGLASSRREGLLSWQALLQSSGQEPLQADWPQATSVAFRFARITADGQLEQQSWLHGRLLEEGAHLAATEKLSHRDRAFAARAFATEAQVRYLLAPWLLTGFTLNFPENLATRDNDRRELGPTLVAGTRDTWGRLAVQVQARLPEPGSWQRRLVDWGLKGGHRGPAGWLAWWLVLRPLQDVLGLIHTRSPLLVGPGLSAADETFFRNLGLEVRPWPDSAEWQVTPVAEPVVTARWNVYSGPSADGAV